MECFRNPLDLFHLTIWDRTHRKLQRGEDPIQQTLKVIKQTLYLWHSKWTSRFSYCQVARVRSFLVVWGVTLHACYCPAVSYSVLQCSLISCRSKCGVKWKHLFKLGEPSAVFFAFFFYCFRSFFWTTFSKHSPVVTTVPGYIKTHVSCLQKVIIHTKTFHLHFKT